MPEPKLEGGLKEKSAKKLLNQAAAYELRSDSVGDAKRLQKFLSDVFVEPRDASNEDAVLAIWQLRFVKDRAESIARRRMNNLNDPTAEDGMSVLAAFINTCH